MYRKAKLRQAVKRAALTTNQAGEGIPSLFTHHEHENLAPAIVFICESHTKALSDTIPNYHSDPTFDANYYHNPNIHVARTTPRVVLLQ